MNIEALYKKETGKSAISNKSYLPWEDEDYSYTDEYIAWLEVKVEELYFYKKLTTVLGEELYNGQRLIAIESAMCGGCFFLGPNSECKISKISKFQCGKGKRPDNKNVIWILKDEN